MTPAKAAQIRTRRIEVNELSNTEKRNIGKAVGKTIDVIFEEYVNYKKHKPSTRQPEKAKYIKYIHPVYGFNDFIFLIALGSSQRQPPYSDIG